MPNTPESPFSGVKTAAYFLMPEDVKLAMIRDFREQQTTATVVVPVEESAAMGGVAVQSTALPIYKGGSVDQAAAIWESNPFGQ